MARPTRRTLLAAAGPLWVGSRAWSAGAYRANDAVSVGLIGSGGMQWGFHSGGLGTQSVAAICDVHEGNLNKAAERFPKAAKFADYRKLLEQKGLDAVLVSVPDHSHAPAAVAAMKAGLHVYCEKPLAHDLFEVRTMIETARSTKRVTQMGTQIHAGDNYRRVVELVQSGAIGAVKEAHAWVGSVWGRAPEEGDRPKETPPVPAGLNWDLWLGPAPERPYHPAYVPTAWRGWWDFGGGALADMGCHFIDCIFWALKLRHPLTAQAEGPMPHAESAPNKCHAWWEFPGVTLHWWDGGLKPEILPEKQRAKWGGGILFVGEKGMLLSDYGRHMLLPEEKFDGFAPPAPSIAPSPGHHAEWFEAIKTGGTTSCNFDYSGTLTETVLLGTVAFRTGEKLEWDGPGLKVENSAKAQALVRRDYRKGWTL